MSGAQGFDGWSGQVAEWEGLPRPLPVLTAPSVVPTAAAAAVRVGLATEKRGLGQWPGQAVTGS